MRTRLGLFLGAALTLAAVLAPAAGADIRLRKAPAVQRTGPETFTCSGTSSGSIAGEIRVGGTSYRLARDARIYEVGRGLVPVGTAYFDRVVTVSGHKVRNQLIVENVLVRPPSYSFGGGAVGTLDQASPR